MNPLPVDKPARILIVDDDPMMRMLMAETLYDNENYVISEVDNGTDALRSIEAEPPDMVLLDVKMPGVSGFEVCAQIREKYDHHDISIVVVTGLDDAESIEKAFDLGATAFINKPINPITFPYRIQYLLSSRQAFIELKQRETHLEYMDRISRILTHSKDLDVILDETLQEMSNIFQADYSAILKSDSNSPYAMTRVCHNISPRCQTIATDIDISQQIGHESFYRARHSEYPILLNTHDDADANASSQQILLKGLNLLDNQTWYVILQRSGRESWDAMQQETFYRITIRLSSVLTQHMLMQRLHKSEALLRQAQHIGKLGNWSLNIQTGELHWSDEIYRIYGYEPGVFLPSLNSLHHRVVPEDIDRLTRFEQNAFYSGKKASIEYRIQLPDGQIRWLHKQGMGEFDDNGVMVGINGTVQDITESKLKQEQELHEQKMDAVGQLTSGVAHDFGNLMTIAKGNLEMLDNDFMARYEIEADDREIIEDARSAIADGVQLTRQLLAFSRKKSIAPEAIDVAETIHNFSHLFRKTLGDTIELNIKIADGLPAIHVDPSQFESSLLNAVINARDAMPKGGRLTIHAKLHERIPGRVISDNTDGEASRYLCITLSDTGEGMPAEILQRATVPFFTTKQNEGTGLGLSMIYGFMRQSHGALDIQSKPGEGTCILMYFPLPESDNERAIAEEKIVTPYSLQALQSHLNILVVDDRDAVRRFAVRCLKTVTPNIFQAENADAAMQILRQQPVDILFSDILMPGKMNGRDLARWTHEHYPQTQILLTTASERESDAAARENAGEFPLLPKPYSQSDLLHKINTLLPLDTPLRKEA